jgi:hypothetical protein
MPPIKKITSNKINTTKKITRIKYINNNCRNIISVVELWYNNTKWFNLLNLVHNNIIYKIKYSYLIAELLLIKVF